MRFSDAMIFGLKASIAAFAAYGLSTTGALGQQRFGSVYQEIRSETCDSPDSSPCTVAFSVLTRAPLKVLKASCTILTSEGGSPSKEVTGASLGRLTENGKTYVAGQFLAPIQSEFSGPGQVTLNFLVDTLLVVPRNLRPAIRISRLNGPPVAATCSVVGEELDKD